MRIVKKIFIFVICVSLSFFNIIKVSAWEATNIELSNIRIEDNNVVGFDISLNVPDYLGTAISWIGIQKEKFNDGDFTNFGNINFTYSFHSLSDLKSNTSFVEEYGIVGFAPDDNDGFLCFGEYTDISQSLQIANIPLDEEDTYNIYLWTLLDDSMFYPDAYLGKLVLDGEGNIEIYNSTGIIENIESFYQVKFDTYGGTSIDPEIIEKSETIIKPENPIREGYTFGGWYSDPNFTTEFDFNNPITSNTTIYAKWTKNKVNVTYSILDGNNQTYIVDTNIDIIIKSDGDLNKLEGIKVDGKLIDEENYETKNGSTILTLKSSYLNDLDIGSHTLEFVYNDGSVVARFNVANAELNDDTNQTISENIANSNVKTIDNSSNLTTKGNIELNNPKTYDNIYTYVIMLVLCLIGFDCRFIKSKKSGK